MSSEGEGSGPGERQLVSTGTPWEPLVGYSRAIRVGSHIYVSGTTATDAGGNVVGPGDPRAQTEQTLRNIEAALRRLGAGLEQVVRTRIYVTNIDQWEAIGRVHGEFFSEILPATSMIEVSGLIDPDMLVEIEAEAILPESNPLGSGCAPRSVAYSGKAAGRPRASSGPPGHTGAARHC